MLYLGAFTVYVTGNVENSTLGYQAAATETAYEYRLASGPITPDTISIPSIDVETTVEKVGVTAEGDMAVPSTYETVGWYREGYLPGEAGHAVIAGHYDNGKGDTAVFWELDELAIGDEIEIANESGERLVFVVTDINEYEFDNAPLEEIYGPSEAPRLSLITCEGAWLDDLDTYQKRLVVTAELKTNQTDTASTTARAVENGQIAQE